MTRSVNTPERVAAHLSRSILLGEILPGEPVRQDEWARRLGVSKIPIREAFKILTSRHLLTHEVNRGYFVAKISTHEVIEIYEIRRFLENEILRSLRWPTIEELSGLTETFEHVKQAIDDGDVGKALDSEREFFFALFDLSPRTVYVREAKELWSLFDQYRASGLVALLASDANAKYLTERRRLLLEALERHDRKQLIEVMASMRENLLDRMNLRPPGRDSRR